jgi:hypothetical protein
MSTEDTPDPREAMAFILASENIPDIASIRPGQFIACQAWKRPRRVQMMDMQEDGHVLFLAEPDADRADDKGIRVVTEEDYGNRGTWRRFPLIQAIWDTHICS